MPQIQLTLVIGQYAQAWHRQETDKNGVTQTVKDWQKHWPQLLPLPHPSPRNNIWLKQNPWFAAEVLPSLQSQVASLLNG